MNLYNILGIDEYASTTEIKEAYRKRAKILHPDVSTGNAEAFKVLNNAYNEILNKPRKIKNIKESNNISFVTINPKPVIDRTTYKNTYIPVWFSKIIIPLNYIENDKTIIFKVEGINNYSPFKIKIKVGSVVNGEKLFYYINNIDETLSLQFYIKEYL